MGKGSIIILPNITLDSVLYVPKLDCTLLSISKITRDLKCVTKFFPNLCEFQTLESGKTIGNAEECAGLYLLRVEKSEEKLKNNCHVAAAVSSDNNPVMMWHYRLGHPNFIYLEKMFPSLFNKNKEHFQCEICQLSKHTRNHYSPQSYKPSKPFSLIHSDVWGPSRVHNITGSRWFVTFIDDHTRVTWVFLMKEKSEVGRIFEIYHKMVQTQFQSNIQILRTDNGPEYYNLALNSYLQKVGIVHQSSCVDTPQQNGVAERKNKHLLEVTRSIMLATNVPQHFWGEAVLSATHLINRTPSRILNFKTPLSTLQNLFPTSKIFSFIPLKIFGCSTFVHNLNPHRSKLDPKSIKCIFLGYSPHQKGYRCYSPHTKKFYHTMDVTFFENQPYYTKTGIQGEHIENSEYQLLPLELTEHDKILPNQTDNTQSAELMPKPAEKLPDQTSNIQPSESTTEDVKETEPIIVSTTSQQDCDPKTGKWKGFCYKRKEVESSKAPMQGHESNQTLENEVPTGNILPNSEHVDTIDIDIPIAMRKGVRTCTKHPIEKYISYGKLSQSYRSFVAAVDNIEVPNNIQEALQKPEWAAAVTEEVQALVRNGTWEITVIPEGKKAVGCKWIFSIKHNADGSINRYKARLVAKEFTQSYGVDYEETFAPVAKLNSVRVLLSLEANLDWPLHQLDIKNAFLNGELEEEVYMQIPSGLESPGTANMVCRLRKSLYGLKQSPRAWFDRLTKVVKQDGFVQCQTDHTMFVKHSLDGKIALFIVYVDDIVITGDDDEQVNQLKKLLAKEFEVKDLGQLKYFLGMEIARTKNGISVSQRKYTLDLLQETGMLGCKAANTPIEQVKRSEDENLPANKDRYQSLVGKLIYLTHTRPDIGFAVSMASRYMSNPTETDMRNVNRILQYLKGTPGRGLYFQKNSNRDIEVYTDSDWAGCLSDRKSTTGYCTFVWGNMVTWRSKKQSIVARSSAEAEFRVMSQGICEGIWLKRMLDEIKIPTNHPMKILCDNKAAISIAKNPVQHDRTKHVEIDRHFIKEKIDHEIISVNHIPSCQQTADILTKALPRNIYENIRSNLGMIDIYHPD
jgi:IS30 family transposase